MSTAVSPLARGVAVAERIRQHPPVDFSVRRQWERVDRRNHRGNHEFRKSLTQVSAQLAPRGVLVLVQLHPGDDARIVAAPRSESHDGLLDRLVSAEDGFDLTELDPIAPEFDLIVAAADELQREVVPETDDVARSVHAFRRPARQREHDESFGRQVRAISIPARDPCSADAELAGCADGTEPS